MPRAKIKNVYFIKPVGLDGPIKIGCSHLPAFRILELSVWSPWPLEIIGSVTGTYQDESFLHQCFADCHSHREWFHSTPALRAAIAAVISAGAVAVLRGTHAPKGKIRVKRERTPEQRLHFSYSSRIRCAQKKLRTLGEHTAWHAPEDVHSIVTGWFDYRGRGQTPSAAEFARLDEYLANPAAHSVVPSWVKTTPHLITLIEQAAAGSA